MSDPDLSWPEVLARLRRLWWRPVCHLRLTLRLRLHAAMDLLDGITPQVRCAGDQPSPLVLHLPDPDGPQLELWPPPSPLPRIR